MAAAGNAVEWGRHDGGCSLTHHHLSSSPHHLTSLLLAPLLLAPTLCDHPPPATIKPYCSMPLCQFLCCPMPLHWVPQYPGPCPGSHAVLCPHAGSHTATCLWSRSLIILGSTLLCTSASGSILLHASMSGLIFPHWVLSCPTPPHQVPQPPQSHATSCLCASPSPPWVPWCSMPLH